MTAHHMHHHHESHGNHPMSIVGFMLVLGGFVLAALWLISMASAHTGTAILCGLLMVAAFTGAVTIFTSLIHRNHHSPVVPDNTPDEAERYMRKYRG
ncbi:hypothetical protein Gbro_3486 [Gordonia bronchialis DSM 43247]|uniref:Uncharacterized protein n=1 Tax=Gordonia bronchialis (strain ATCC 25592 / DSM 43247 / BCRC 13721 / JCM 3198 / KCTC 3076 / NBRC 16047 / NCTC 10667) TaxID=526226 RepID=D0LE87_GORB4|nr:hypothetical protein [Gordonia bronchialis]ACY22679.1 hypothetical protein Gbro_3486 [Gordonia bronchialis DSM 43247]MCC3325461.1 hypothetical protein [Gordonia bronchialis]QGS23855.1 hypothetical protein FOB84_06350 [Gordonia bronchialis]UAK39968.1 hypothetical protein K8O93_10295 [Gordonia bronchialis]STQ65620.1 Uncharacterised protein [Gordonia bronchialis]